MQCAFCTISKIESDDPISKTTYTKMDEKIEKMSRLIELILIKITIPVCLAPVFTITAINFFIYSLGNESFYYVIKNYFVNFTSIFFDVLLQIAI